MPNPACLTFLTKTEGAASPCPANDDNIDPEAMPLLRGALRLSTTYGRHAATYAHGRCEEAFFSADGAAFRWWSAMTRILDRQLDDGAIRSGASARALG